jgi:hypothetical protein
MYADTMIEIVEVQIRLIIGTVAMFVAGSLIFGVNFVNYGIADVIRMAFYIQGALLVITSFGWMHILPDVIWNLIDWVQEVNEKYHIFTVTSIVEEFEEEVEDVNEVASTDERDAENLLLDVETKLRKELGIDIEDKKLVSETRSNLTDDEKLRFDALLLVLDNTETARMILKGSNFYKLSLDPLRVNGSDVIVTIEAETAEC